MTQQYAPAHPQQTNKRPRSTTEKVVLAIVAIIVTAMIAFMLFIGAIAFNLVRHGRIVDRTVAEIGRVDGVESVETKNASLHTIYVVTADPSQSPEQVKQVYNAVHGTIVASTENELRGSLSFSQDYKGATIQTTTYPYNLTDGMEAPISALTNEIDAGALSATARYESERIDGKRTHSYTCSAVYTQLPTDLSDHSYDGCHEMNRYTEEDTQR